MLQEVAVAQKEKGIYRRWFEDEYFQLIIWYDLHTGGTLGFQLCYDISHDAHSVTWMDGEGIIHNKIDDGSRPFRHPSSPVLVADGIFPAEMVLKRFTESCGSLEAGISELVISRISGFDNTDEAGDEESASQSET